LKSTRSIGFCILLALVSALSAAANAAAFATADTTSAAALAGKPALWAQAVHVFELNKDFVPGKMSQKVLELDDKGAVKSTTDADISLSLDPAGKIKTDIVKATKDGKDVTADERKKAAEREKKAAKEEAKQAEAKKAAAKKDSKKDAEAKDDEESHSISLGDGPFDPKIQKDVRLKETPARETIEGHACVCYEYSYLDKPKKPSKEKPATIKGKAWLDEATGSPVRVEFTSDPLPKHVQSMSTSIVYGPEADKWIVTSMSFQARASFLVIKKNIRGDMVFSNYWKYVEPKEEK
jgi:hypothetical protein